MRAVPGLSGTAAQRFEVTFGLSLALLSFAEGSKASAHQHNYDMEQLLESLLKSLPRTRYGASAPPIMLSR